MRTLNETLGELRGRLQEWILDEVSDDPVLRAKERMRDAWKRGGYTKMITATRVRIKATKSPLKLQGIVMAVKQIIQNDEFPLTPAQEKELQDLLNSIS